MLPTLCPPHKYSLVVSKRSACPSRGWLPHVAPTLRAALNRDRPVVLLNVGANKGGC